MLFINTQCGKLFVHTGYLKNKNKKLEPNKFQYCLCSGIGQNNKKIKHTGKRKGKNPSCELVSKDLGVIRTLDAKSVPQCYM